MDQTKGVYYLKQHLTQSPHGVVVGVLGSPSEERRLYVVAFGHDGGWFCRTNHGQTCSSSRDNPCKHVRNLLTGAINALGPESVSRLLNLDLGEVNPENIVESKKGMISPVFEKRGDEMIRVIPTQVDGVEAGQVFAAAGRYLNTCEWEIPWNRPIPEMAWFPSPPPSRY